MPEPVRRGDAYWIYLRKEGISITESTADRCKAKAIAARAGYIATATKKKLTLTAAIDEYIDSKSNVLSPETIRGYRIIQRHRFPELMSKDISTIDVTTAQKAVNNAVSDGLSAKSICNAWRFITTVISLNTGNQLKVKMPQLIQKEKEYLDAEEIKKFCTLIKDTEIEIYCLMALHSLRNSEIMALSWDKIDLEAKTIRIEGAVVRNEKNKFVSKEENKNTSSRRTVPIMIDQLYDALSEADKTKPIFEYHCETYARKLAKLCEENKLPHITPHSLRHTFASLALTTLNMPESVVMKIGGWSTPNTMKKIYRHAADSEITKQAEAMKDFYSDHDKNMVNSQPQLDVNSDVK